MVTSEESLEEEVSNRKLLLHYQQTKSIIILTMIGSAILTYSLWQFTSLSILLYWFVAHTLFNAGRYGVKELFFQRDINNINVMFWIRLYQAGCAINSFFWASLVFLVFYTMQSHPQLDVLIATLAICLTIVVSSSIVAYTVSFSTQLIICVCTLLPPGVFLITQPSPTLSFLGVVLLFYFSVIVFLSYRLTNMINKPIRYHLQNEILLSELKLEKQAISQLNQQLEEDITKRESIEMQLVEEKQKAENLASKLLSLSAKDGLTGIANRRHLDEFLGEEWRRAAREGIPLSVIMCDIDYFKQYNDHYGHQAGDTCLRLVADLLGDYARRGGDLAARFGGEEFVLILPNTNERIANQIAHQICRDLREVELIHEHSQHQIVTASFGVATLCPHNDIPSSSIIGYADNALYEAKNLGRNRVVTAKIGDTLQECC